MEHRPSKPLEAAGLGWLPAAPAPMAVPKIRWYVKAQLGVLLLPAGLCVFGEAVIRKAFQPDRGPWFWYGTLGLILINAGVGLMIESGLLRGYPGRQRD